VRRMMFVCHCRLLGSSRHQAARVAWLPLNRREAIGFTTKWSEQKPDAVSRAPGGVSTGWAVRRGQCSATRNRITTLQEDS